EEHHPCINSVASRGGGTHSILQLADLHYRSTSTTHSDLPPHRPSCNQATLHTPSDNLVQWRFAMNRGRSVRGLAPIPFASRLQKSCRKSRPLSGCIPVTRTCHFSTTP